jgi:hypothetical protein
MQCHAQAGVIEGTEKFRCVPLLCSRVHCPWAVSGEVSFELPEFHAEMTRTQLGDYTLE